MKEADSAKAVIFDMDGVLVDSEPLHYQAEKVVLAGFGLDFTRELHAQYIGYASEQKFWTDLTRSLGVSLPVPRLTSLKKDYFFAHLHEIKIIAPAVRLLRWLCDRSVPLALASSSSMELITGILNTFDLAGFFRVLQSGEDVANGKPAPDIFLAAARQLGVEPAACIVIEDSIFGVRGGKAAGMTVVAVPNAYTLHFDYRGAGADFILDSLDEFGKLKLITEQ
jgi:HAD superfamily hydrolase (TIGR01509 family)